MGLSAVCSGPWRPASDRRHAAGQPVWLSCRRWPVVLGCQPLLPLQCWRLLHARRPGRSTALRVCSAASWPSDDGPLMALLELRSKLKPLGLAFRQAVQALWEAQRRWLQHVLVRMALGLGLLAAAATLAANAWGVPAINRRLLPQVQATASTLLQREVAIGAVRWVAPTGLVGLTPLGCLGPVRVGPGPVEGSSTEVQRVTLGVDPVQSALQRRIVLAVRAQGVHVDLVQASNYSWFGYPEDTTPSARNFVPGAGRGGGSSSEGGSGSSSSDGGGAVGAGPAAAASSSPGKANTGVVAAAPSAATTANAEQRMEAAVCQAAASSRQLQELVDRLALGLAQGAAAQRPHDASQQQPAVVLMGFGGADSSQPEQQHMQQQPGDAPGSTERGYGLFHSASDLLFNQQQQQQPGEQSQELARAAPGSSNSGGIFGGKLGWPRGQPQQPQQPQQDVQQPQPTSQPPPSSMSTQRQRQVATLNAMRLQAGRGYTLQERGGDAVPADSSSSASSTDTLQGVTVSCCSSSVAGEPSAANRAPTSAGVQLGLDHSSSAGTSTSEQQLPQQPQQHVGQQVPQHRKLHLRRIAATAQREQQMVPPTAPAASQSPAPAATRSSSGALDAASRVPLEHGSAATLNKQLQRLRTRSAKLFSASPAHSLEQLAARSAAAAAEAKPDEPTPAVLAKDAVDTEPATTMTAEQRREVVARINCLPAIMVQQRQRASAAAAASAARSSSSMAGGSTVDEEHLQGAGQPTHAAVGRVNSIGVLEAPEGLKPSALVSSFARGVYASQVVDPTTQRKKGGSASLPWSHQRPPATALIGSRVGTGRQEQLPLDMSTSAAVVVNEGITGTMFASAASPFESVGPGAAVGDSFQLEPEADQASAAAGKAGNSRRQALMHPGYFTAARGPNYTPAPPEALIDARNRRSTLKTYIWAALDAAAGRLQGVEVALGGILVQDATVDAHVHGEGLPRRFEDVAASVRLGCAYGTLSVDLTATPRHRHPSSIKCTMPSQHAHRHLRHVTGADAVRTYEQQQQQQQPGAAFAEAAAAMDASSNVPSADVVFNGRPTGGRVRIRVEASGITGGVVPPPPSGRPAQAGRLDPAPSAPVPTLDIRVEGRDLHAPIIERLIELPMDISAGRANGELRIYSHDARSWHFPEFYGRVDVRGADFHFWDATDDIMGANLDLFFERDRLYMHNASGSFGAVPMTLTGDLDLNPEGGQYRLSTSVSGVEVNQLRATLGLRPTPQPVAGGVAGVLHVTGPLEKPVFSGTAWAVRPDATQLVDCEATEALAALAAEPAAVVAWDHVPLLGAGAVFSLDMARETLELHSAHALLADGGQLSGSGSMWVAPRAEMDPSAVAMRAEGQGLAAEAVLRRYLPEGMALPPGMVVGHANLSATLQGSHLEPALEVVVQLPEASASCTAQLHRTAARLTLASPHADTAATLHLLPPSFDAVKAAVTQAQATALAVPNVAGLDGEVGLRGLDVVPLVSGDGEAALRQLAVQSGQPLRLKLNGRAKVSGTVRREQVQQAPVAAAGQVTPAAAHGGIASAAGVSWEFAGDLGLESMRVNQLKLFQKLAARLSVSSTGISVHGKGMRASEMLDLDLALPLPGPAKLPQLQAAVPPADPSADAGQAAATTTEKLIAASIPAAVGHGATLMGETSTVVTNGMDLAQQQPAPQRGGSGLQMRCGPLQVAADINAAGSQLDFKVAMLKLDELELASLRGDLQVLHQDARVTEVSCSLNFETHTGRGKMSLANPRYSGLRGDSLSGGFRWERDVVRLEKLVLQQQRSRYEVQGEYSLPPNTRLPSSAADLALPAAPGDTAVAAKGRWRVQVSVPWAELQEIVPAARLLQSATSLSPAEYERAKAVFLRAIEQSNIKAAELNTQLRLMAEQLHPPASDGSAGTGRQDAGRGGAELHLPGLQDMRGQWNGSMQAYGGGSSATSCDFDVKGQSWQWGAYALDALLANGSFHSEEGVQLQEFVLKAGDAKLSVRGSLLGEHQDASLLLTDFPMATLHPVFRAVPALQHTVPAVPAERPQPIASPRPLGMLTNALGRVTKGLGLPGAGLGDADSPINGLLYVSGNIAGSRAQPTGEVAVRLYDAAVGQTRLSQAQASARLSEAQQLSFNVEVVPAEGHRQAGYVRAGGVVPLAEAAASNSGSGKTVEPSQQQMDVRLSVKDGGMALLTSIMPDLRWQGGLAAIDVQLRGPLEQPVLSGSASISRATLDCPLLRFPLTNASAEVRAGSGMLTVESLDARCGRRGHIRARGSLPVYGGSGERTSRGMPMLQQPPQHKLMAEASALELRVRNMYSGQYDASLAITSSLASPTVAGGMRFSKGIVFIVPQGAPDVAGAASGASDTLLTPTGTSTSGQQQGGGRASVAKVFDILTRGESGVAQQFEAVMKQEVEAVEHMVEDAGQHNVSLDRLCIALGPDLRAMYPLVMNFGVEGELGVSGPAHPDQVRVHGTLRLPSGDVNLVATQLALDRDHANLVTFQPEQSGLDPLVDLVMSGGDLRVAIKGKASEWQEHLTLHYISNKARPDSGEQLDAADAARLFEDKLKAALLAEDGQLALSRLAGTTVSTLMPRIETQGALGGTRWRLVSAPSIPGLLSLDPSLADPSNILNSITMGTEVEIQFGKKLQAAMIRKLQESDVTTQWSLNYKLNNKLRMQFNITSAPPFPKTLMFHWSSMGNDS